MGRTSESWKITEAERTLLRAALEAAKPVTPDWRALPVGRMLRRLRREMGLHQDTLAFRVGMRQSMVSRIERGADLRLSTLRRLLAAMNCELVVLPYSARDQNGLRALNRLQEAERQAKGRRALAEMVEKLRK